MSAVKSDIDVKTLVTKMVNDHRREKSIENREKDEYESRAIFESVFHLARSMGLPVFEIQERKAASDFHWFLMSFNTERKITVNIEEFTKEAAEILEDETNDLLAMSNQKIKT